MSGSTYPLGLVRSRLSIATATVDFAVSSGSSGAPAIAGATAAATSATGGAFPSVAAKPSAALASGYHTASAGSTAASAVSGAAKALKSKYSPKDLTMWGMTLKVMREEGGVKGLYRGLVTTAVGVAPYVGINFAAYEALRGIITPPGKTSVGRKLSCGALAGV